MRLLSCQPNPFAGTTAIHYELPATLAISLGIYDVAGRLVQTLVAGDRAPGRHVVRWDRTASDGAHVSSGVYFVQLKTTAGESVQRVVVID